MGSVDPGTAISEDFSHQCTLSSGRKNRNVFGADDFCEVKPPTDRRRTDPDPSLNADPIRRDSLANKLWHFPLQVRPFTTGCQRRYTVDKPFIIESQFLLVPTSENTRCQLPIMPVHTAQKCFDTFPSGTIVVIHVISS